MFSSIVQLGQVRLRGKRGECSGAISYHYVPVDISLSLSDSHLWFPLAIFHRCTKRGFIMAPVKKGPKCPYRPSLIRKQRCVRPCHSSSIHIYSLDAFRYAIILFSPPPLLLSLSLFPCMCCKYTIAYVEVSGMRGWWRAGLVIFLELLKLRWPVCRRVALCQRVFHALLTNYLTGGGNYFTFSSAAFNL